MKVEIRIGPVEMDITLTPEKDFEQAVIDHYRKAAQTGQAITVSGDLDNSIVISLRH